jgi:hypothetical protein
MRDWKIYRPDSGGSGASGATRQPLERSRRLNVDPEVDDPQFEIALDMDTDQLQLMFDDAVKSEQRSHSGPAGAASDYQEEWRKEALGAKADIAETFGPWSDESRVEGATYYRKASRLG